MKRFLIPFAIPLSFALFPRLGLAQAKDWIPSTNNDLPIWEDRSEEKSPAWYQKKKKDEKEAAEKAAREAAERARKMSESPEVGGPRSGPSGLNVKGMPEISQISGPGLDATTAPQETGSRLTGTAFLGMGPLFQRDVAGFNLSGGYALGTWLTPYLVLGGLGRALAIPGSDYYFLMVSVGPQIRYYLNQNWAVGGDIGYAASIGLSHGGAARIPTPANSDRMRARQGPLVGFHVARLFWSKKELGIGPVLDLRAGIQSERYYFQILVGVTFQDGRPNFTGSVMETETW